jgi:hypothetical protein
MKKATMVTLVLMASSLANGGVLYIPKFGIVRCSSASQTVAIEKLFTHTSERSLVLKENGVDSEGKTFSLDDVHIKFNNVQTVKFGEHSVNIANEKVTGKALNERIVDETVICEKSLMNDVD